jgi:hypothetical protein
MKNGAFIVVLESICRTFFIAMAFLPEEKHFFSLQIGSSKAERLGSRRQRVRAFAPVVVELFQRCVDSLVAPAVTFVLTWVCLR